MQNLPYSELWKRHFADPNDSTIRAQISLRDQGRSDDQLWPITAPCLVHERAEEHYSDMDCLEAERDELADDLSSTEASLEEANKELEEVEAENSRLTRILDSHDIAH